MASSRFHFKQFALEQEGAAHPVGTDGVLLGAWADVANANRILDIGTGTGLIALMLAQRTGQAQIDAVDMQETSAAQARDNVVRSPWPERIQVYCAAIQDFAAQYTGVPYDLIVSNPPFFTEGLTSPDAARSTARSAETLAPADLADCARQLLTPEGRFCVVLPETEGRVFVETATLRGLYCVRETAVRSRATKPIQRLLLEFSPRARSFQRDDWSIYGDGNAYSTVYKNLTKDFYLRNRL